MIDPSELMQWSSMQMVDAVIGKDDAGTCPECEEETRECACIDDRDRDIPRNYVLYQDDDQRLGGHDNPIEPYYGPFNSREAEDTYHDTYDQLPSWKD